MAAPDVAVTDADGRILLNRIEESGLATLPSVTVAADETWVTAAEAGIGSSAGTGPRSGTYAPPWSDAATDRHDHGKRRR